MRGVIFNPAETGHSENGETKPMKNISIQQITEQEYDKIKPLADTIWHICYKDILSEDQIKYMLDMMYCVDVISKECSQKVRYCYILDEGKTAGFLAWGPCEKDNHTAKLHKLYLLPQKQGSGIGGAAITLVKKDVKSAGFTRLLLNVNRRNANALKCYQKNGFQIIRQEDNAIGNGYYMNDFVMESCL